MAGTNRKRIWPTSLLISLGITAAVVVVVGLLFNTTNDCVPLEDELECEGPPFPAALVVIPVAFLFFFPFIWTMLHGLLRNRADQQPPGL